MLSWTALIGSKITLYMQCPYSSELRATSFIARRVEKMEKALRQKLPEEIKSLEKSLE
jgi:hypothetical protein